MPYISDSGRAIGGICLDTTWVQPLKIEYLGNNNITKTKRYLTISNSKLKEFNATNDIIKLAPVIAASPDYGFHTGTLTLPDGTTQEGLVCDAPENSLVTIKWLMTYAAIDPGTTTFNPDLFVTLDQLIVIQNKLDDNTKKIEINTESIELIKQELVDINSQLDINTENIDTNTANIAQNAEDIKNLQENPFPDGLWLICGGANLS